MTISYSIHTLKNVTHLSGSIWIFVPISVYSKQSNVCFFRYKNRAAKALALYVRFVAPFRGLTATLHILYCHGHQFLEWAEKEVGDCFRYMPFIMKRHLNKDISPLSST